MGRFVWFRRHVPPSRVRVSPGLALLAVGARVVALLGSEACAAVPATASLRAATERLEEAQSARAMRPGAERPADRTYRLTLAAALLDKAREDAADGRFESARRLAREAARLARKPASPGGGA